MTNGIVHIGCSSIMVNLLSTPSEQNDAGHFECGVTPLAFAALASSGLVGLRMVD